MGRNVPSIVEQSLELTCQSRGKVGTAAEAATMQRAEMTVRMVRSFPAKKGECATVTPVQSPTLNLLAEPFPVIPCISCTVVETGLSR